MTVERVHGRLSDEKRERLRIARELIDAEKEELSQLADQLEPSEEG